MLTSLAVTTILVSTSALHSHAASPYSNRLPRLLSPSTCRDPLIEPFAPTSIWNTPIGADAQMQPAFLFCCGLPLPPRFHVDQEWFITTAETDPFVDVHGGYFANCTVQGAVVTTMRLPHDFVTDCGPNNNAAAVLQPDGRTLVEFQPMYRGVPGGPVMAWFNASGMPAAGDTCHGSDCDLYGNGTSGSHGGSQLSSLGGSIRLGELLPHTPPIRHALKIELVASQYFWWETNFTNYSTCWRWPARTCDGYAPSRYRGRNPFLMPGTLLAIPAERAAELLGKNVTSAPGRKILAALRDFGGYIVDDIGSANEGAALCAEHAVSAEMLAVYGWDWRYSRSGDPDALPGLTPTNAGSAFYWELVAIFQSLSIVVNNYPASVGGGGTPRVPPPPPLCPPTRAL